MAREFTIGADVGSSCMKLALLQPERGVLAIVERPYRMSRPHPDWAENDPLDWFEALRTGIPELLSRAGVTAKQVTALCLVGQRDNCVLIDEAGQVLTPSIHWTDRRDPEETAAVYDTMGREKLISISGTLPIPGLELPNLVWTKKHLPDVWRRTRHILQPKDYLAYHLTGVAGTDPTGPTRSIMNDWRSESWSTEICAEYGIALDLLPEVTWKSWEPRATLDQRAEEIGLLPGTLLVTGGGDDPAAALGSGVIDPGDVSIGTGSSMSWRVVEAEPVFDPSGVIGLMPHVIPDRYLHEMVAVGTGTTLRWLKDSFSGGLDYDTIISEASLIPRGAEGLLCYPYVEGATVPILDDDARATFAGISGHHRLPHFVRATLEGIAYQYPALLDIVRSRGHETTTYTISDGEARSALWNQIKADVLNEPITPALRVEAPSIGAAILAGFAAGMFATIQDGVTAAVELAPVVFPDANGAEQYSRLRSEWEEVRGQLYPAFAYDN